MKVALLGHGTVGSGIEKILNGMKDTDIDICSILVRNIRPDMDERYTDDVEKIFGNKPECIIECLGGDEPAYSYVKRALESGIDVISANKKMLSRHMDLFDTAKSNNTKLLFEASCGGGIPWLINIRRIKRNDEIVSIKGIINGTCNYLLSRLFNEDISFTDALKNAQELGYAEADPSDDICGYDSRYKLTLSIYEAFDKIMDYASIPCFGIDNITDKDIQYAKDNNMVIKLIASADLKGNNISASVMPCFIRKDDIFASVSSNNNILMSDSKYLGKAYFAGQGAGSLPTGHAIVQDLLDLKNNEMCLNESEADKIDNDISRLGVFYIRHQDIAVFKDYIAEKISDDSFISRRCSFKGISDIIDNNHDEKMFIGEINR